MRSNEPDKAEYIARKGERGFTLIELLVVIAIIGLLSGVVLASLNTARDKANDAKRKAEVKTLMTAVGAFYAQNGYLPRNANGWCTYISNPVYTAGFTSDLVPTYLRALPRDPKNPGVSGDYFYANQDNVAGKFTICALLSQSSQSYPQYNGCDGVTVTYNYCVSQ